MKPKKIRLQQPYNCPNLSGEEISDSFELTEELFVDKSGFGSPSEPALTIPQFEQKIQELQSENDNLYWAITNEGQFQIYIGIFEKIS